jgi:hypothetical protein
MEERKDNVWLASNACQAFSSFTSVSDVLFRYLKGKIRKTIPILIF